MSIFDLILLATICSIPLSSLTFFIGIAIVQYRLGKMGIEFKFGEYIY